MTGFGPARRTPPAPPHTEIARLKAEIIRLRNASAFHEANATAWEAEVKLLRKRLAAREEELLHRLRRYEPDAK